MVVSINQWYLTTEEAIGTAVATVAEKRHVRRAAQKRRRMGEANQDGQPTVAAALAELATARAARQTLWMSLRTTLATASDS